MILMFIISSSYRIYVKLNIVDTSQQIFMSWIISPQRYTRAGHLVQKSNLVKLKQFAGGT